MPTGLEDRGLVMPMVTLVVVSDEAEKRGVFDRLGAP